MKLSMICSAFSNGASAHSSAVATSDLIAVLASSNKTVELCIGVYNGEREISLEVTGFENIEEMRYYGYQIMRQFKQECVFLNHDGHAWLQHEGEKPDEYLGIVVKGTPFGLSHQGCSENHTEHLNYLATGVLPAKATTELRKAA